MARNENLKRLTRDPSIWDRLTGYDGPQPLTDEATAELRAEGVKDADLAATGKPITTRMVREPSVMDRLTGYDGPQPLTDEATAALRAAGVKDADVGEIAHVVPLEPEPTKLYEPISTDFESKRIQVPEREPVPPRPRLVVNHATADTSDLVKRTSDRLQALVDPSSQQPTTTADAGEVRPGSMKGFFQNAITGTGTPTEARKPLVPPEVAAFVAKQTGTQLPEPDADAMEEAKRRAGMGDTLASLTDQLEIANGKFDAGRSARLHANAQQPVTDEQARQDQVRAFVEKKLGLERQARQDKRQADLDALNTRNIESQIATREKGKQPAPVDPLDAEKKRAEIAKLEAETERLQRRGTPTGAAPDPSGMPTVSPKQRQQILEVQERHRNILDNIQALEDQIKDTGTWELAGPENGDMERRLNNIATDMAKLTDPSSVARPAEVEGFRQGLFKPGLFTRNSTAKQILEHFKDEVNQRLENAYRVRGIDPAAAQSASGGAQPQGGATPAQPDMVAMVDPQGRPRMVPRNRVQDAINAGGRLAQ